jgi:hypothetical protein
MHPMEIAMTYNVRNEHNQFISHAWVYSGTSDKPQTPWTDNSEKAAALNVMEAELLALWQQEMGYDAHLVDA